jgi:hypothetical protein
MLAKTIITDNNYAYCVIVIKDFGLFGELPWGRRSIS